MIVPAQPLALTEIHPPCAAVTAEQIHAAFAQQGDHPVVGEDGIGQQDVAGAQRVQQLPQESRLAGLLAAVRRHGYVQHRARGQTDQAHQPQDGKAQARLLPPLLRIGFLILRRVRHTDGRAVGDLDRPAAQQARGGNLTL